jgi:hypothetical protein
MEMAHSQDSVVVEHERLVELGPALCAGEAELRIGMGLRASRRKGEWKVGNTIDLILLMLEEWGGGDVRNEVKMVRKQTKTEKCYTLHINENTILWHSLLNSNIKMDDFMIKL